MTVTVNFATSNVVAEAGSDYTAKSGTLTFNPGSTLPTTPLDIQILGDTLDEADESFRVGFLAPSEGALLDNEAIVTIADDDPLASLSVNDVRAVEGDSGAAAAEFTVALSPPSGQFVRVGVTTANGSALAPNDYQGRAQS